MKKPTCASKQWNVIHICNLNRRKVHKTASKKRGKRIAKENIAGRHSIPIKCPPDFSLRSNFDGVVEVLDKIRNQSQRQRNEHCYIDFRDIQNLSPAAALVLAAELDRWNKLPWRQGRLKPVDVADWDPQVRRLLAGMGFFELMQANNPPLPSEDESIRYVKFRTGKKADGEAIDRLRAEDLDPVVGEIPGKHHLYAAVTEAMTNVVHHAYKTNQASKAGQANWWLSASHDSEKHEVAIIIYDQGDGIPKTLPRKFGENISNILRSDHAKMIEAAHELSRSASGEQHRGYGLRRDVRGYLEKLDCRGHYRVVSLQGEYIYEKRLDGVRSTKKTHRRSLSGTLIEWRLFLK